MNIRRALPISACVIPCPRRRSRRVEMSLRQFREDWSFQDPLTLVLGGLFGAAIAGVLSVANWPRLGFALGIVVFALAAVVQFSAARWARVTRWTVLGLYCLGWVLLI